MKSLRLLKSNLVKMCFISVAMIASACNYASVESERILEKGIQQYNENHLDQAMATFKDALDRDPNNDQALFYMAKIDMHYRDFHQASQKIEQALGIDNKPSYWYLLGTSQKGEADLMFADSKFDDSEMLYLKCVYSLNQAVKIDPWYTEAWLEMAHCQIGAKEYADASKSFQKSIESNPTYKSGSGVTAHYKELGELYARFGYHREAMMVLTNGLMNNPSDGQLEVILADVYAAMGEYTDALTHYEGAYKVLKIMDHSKVSALSAMYGAGLVNFEIARKDDAQGNREKAAESYKKAREWFDEYSTAAAPLENEKIRRSDALNKMKRIDLFMESVPKGGE